jgi:hypothetical protein
VLFLHVSRTFYTKKSRHSSPRLCKRDEKTSVIDLNENSKALPIRLKLMGWKSESKRAKKSHRPSLSLDDWGRDGFSTTFPSYVANVLRQKYAVEHFDPFRDGPLLNDLHPTIPAILDACTLTVDEFHDRYEAKGIPCLIKNIPDGYCGMNRLESHSRIVEEKKENDSFIPSKTSPTMPKRWNALDRWTVDSLEKDCDLRDYKLKCGEDDDGYSVRLKLKHFLKYMKRNDDDSPLYIFDSTFDDDDDAKKLLQDYQVPSYFNEDLFSLVGEKRRPPYRWFLVGPRKLNIVAVFLESVYHQFTMIPDCV